MTIISDIGESKDISPSDTVAVGYFWAFRVKGTAGDVAIGETDGSSQIITNITPSSGWHFARDKDMVLATGTTATNIEVLLV